MSVAFKKIAKPIGVIGAVTPATGPTGAVVALALAVVKTRNAAVFCSNPKAKIATRECGLTTLNALPIQLLLRPGFIWIAPHTGCQVCRGSYRRADNVTGTPFLGRSVSQASGSI
jgi:acyl-CoA reductase-like NAD-dependent aldehyde dehydrogenase